MSIILLQMDLLDALSTQANCMYISDLKYLNGWQRVKLTQTLERVTADCADLREWNDALVYLTGSPPQKTAQAARERLITLLSSPGTGHLTSENKGGYTE